jgi:hypothetical protein
VLQTHRNLARRKLTQLPTSQLKFKQLLAQLSAALAQQNQTIDMLSIRLNFVLSFLDIQAGDSAILDATKTIDTQVNQESETAVSSSDAVTKNYVDAQTSATNPNYIKKDGTVAMTANLDLGSNSIINV